MGCGPGPWPGRRLHVRGPHRSSAGPADLLVLSEFLTFPLFGLLVGAGAELGARRLAVVPHGVASLVRGATLLGLGWALAQAGAHIVIVLAPLGVLTLLCWAVSRFPTSGVVAVGLLVSTSYPQAVLLLAGCLGIVLTRTLLPRHGLRPSGRAAAGVLTVSVLVVGSLGVARQTGRVPLAPYETTWVEELFVCALAAGVFAGALLVARWPVSRVLTPLTWVGAMTLTVYALQIGWLAWWVRGLRPGVPDDTWVNVVGMTVGALLVATLWRVADLSRPWSRGPVEGAVAALVDLALALPGVRTSPPAADGPAAATSAATPPVSSARGHDVQRQARG